MSEILLVSASALVFRTFPGDAQDHGSDDGDLHGSDDGRDQDVMQLLSTGDNIEDVKVLRLSALRAFVSRVTPAGGGVVLHLTGAMDTVASITTGAGRRYPRARQLPRVHRSVQDLEGTVVIFLAHLVLVSCTDAQVANIDLLLFHARSLSDQAGVGVRVSICGTHWVLIVTTAVNVTDAPDVLRVLVTLRSVLACATLGKLPAQVRCGAFSVIAIS